VGVDIAALGYRLAAIQRDGDKVYVDEYLTGLTWEEMSGQLAARLTASVVNSKAAKKRIAQLLPNGTHLRLYAGDDPPFAERGRFQVFRNLSSWAGPERRHDITAYDTLFPLQMSADDRYYADGQTGRQIIADIARAWKVPLGKLAGPDTTLGKRAFRGKLLGEMITAVLRATRDRGGGRWYVYAEGGKLHTAKWASNRTGYRFDGDSVTSLEIDRSVEGLKTQVRIVGREKNGSKILATASTPLKATYGTLQAIVNRSDYNKPAGAERAARQLLLKDGIEAKHRSLLLPDVPSLRRGQEIFLSTGTLHGWFVVESITHDAPTRTMMVDVDTERDEDIDIDFVETGLDSWVPPDERKDKGGKVPVGGPSAKGFSWPTAVRRVTSDYGPRTAPTAGASSFHEGIDIGAQSGTPVAASKDGVVTFAGLAGGYGNLVKIRHEGGYETRYAHLDSISVRSGKVKRGEQIAKVGATGTATAPHLHFEVRTGGEAIDPLKVLP
jgi:hypothetical protein